MIKVLEHGKPYKQEKIFYLVECPRCYCQFEFQKEDCQDTIQPSGTKDFRFSIACPDCNEIISKTTVALQKRIEYEIVPVNCQNHLAGI